MDDQTNKPDETGSVALESDRAGTESPDPGQANPGLNSETTENGSGPAESEAAQAKIPDNPRSQGPPVWSRPPGRRTINSNLLPNRTHDHSRLEGWPLAILILGLAIIASCHFSTMNMVNSIGENLVAVSATGVTKPSVGVLAVEGEIMSSMWAVKTLKQFQEDPNILAVVLRLDTPGGAVAPCQEIVETLRTMTKPVVASMGSVTASGGVYLAVAGDHIMANPGTLTGSIGVVMETIQVQGAMEKLGVKAEVFTSGQYKDIGSPFRDMKPEERAIIQTMVMEVYEQFVGEVIKGRPNLNEEKVRQMADGRVFSGQEALRLGLIDELGSFDNAVQKAIIMAKGSYDPTEDIPLIYEDGRGTLIQRLLSSGQFFFKPSSILSQEGLKFLYRPGL
ncbi:MAG: signal peptide peptidase SppA [Deltaproteobacteria bacterium]|jgi:protease-4|nr:signal peptide peptidase SppA [Deltaproteobacteria bacterium]